MRTISWMAPKASCPGKVGMTPSPAQNVVGVVDVRPILSKDHRAGGKYGGGPHCEESKQSNYVAVGGHDTAPDMVQMLRACPGL